MGRNLILVLNRLMQSLVSLFVLASLCFFLLKAFPGSPFDQETRLTPQITEKLNARYGLDQPWFKQYGLFIQGLLKFDFGQSMHFEGKSVSKVIAEALPTTLAVGGLALLVSIVFGFVLGFSSVRYLQAQTSQELFVLFAISMPTLLLGPLLIWLFGFKLSLLPVALLETPLSFVLPVFILSLRPIAILSRLLRNSLGEALRSDYTRTAKAMGLSQTRILMKWALKNSLIPFLSYLGILIAGLLSGSLIVEMLFALPGLGTQFLDSLVNRDYSLITGLALFYGFLLILSQFLIDVLIQWLDPRIKSL